MAAAVIYILLAVLGVANAENIARGGRVAQSSVFDVGIPERAIDGNRESSWYGGSCTHTLQDNRPWWRLDLHKRYKIYTVTITNRGDAVSERLNGAEIHIGDSLEDNGNSNPRCAAISSIAAGASETFKCKGMTGQYVNIVIPNRHEYLTLCEVEVTGDPAENIARGGRVAQSSVFDVGIPERAIDGNRESSWYGGSCSHTLQDNRPWWRLDLHKRYKIYTVTITNRGDAVSERLNGAEIHIGDSLEDNGNSNPRCAAISSIAAGASETFKCEGMTGQYVNIVIPNRHEYLTLCEVEVTGDPAGSTCQSDHCSNTNIARGGRVTQSSIFEGATAERAVDGNLNSAWGQGSCTHTQQDNRPWWRLDLQKRYKIYTVTITNRGDAVSERLDDAWILIGDSLEDNGNSNPRCAAISSIAAGASETFKCEGMTGQYVNIVIPNRHEYLTLCEVEVTGDPAENIARGGRVAQSSVFDVGFPERAIDGNRDSSWYGVSCTHTQQDNKPWWRLDLHKRYRIYTVTITNRGDAVSERLNDAEIRIGDSLEDNGNSNPRCAAISSIAAGASETFKCEGMTGQYVNIVIPNRHEYLTLCEVEVTGDPAENIARGGRVAQSSIFDVGFPERAIDGNRESSWYGVSCSHTLQDNRPWWRLDLLKRYKIYTVTITNRGDAVSERLNGAEIHIGDSLEDNGNSNPRCAVIKSIPAGASETFECNGMKGQYINIVIPNRQEYLTLCEVEVTGIEYNEGSEVDICSQV